MTASTKDLIERARSAARHAINHELLTAMADALERLTQPVGVEPIAFVVFDEGGPGFCAGWETACHEHINDAINEHDCVEAAKWKVVAVSPTADLARLIAERDAALGRVAELWQALSDMAKAHDALQEQVKMLRDALELAASYLETTSDNLIDKALAATEPKEKT